MSRSIDRSMASGGLIAALIIGGVAQHVQAVPVVTYVGAETSGTSSGAWGVTPTTGSKRDFRSTDSDTKAWTLPGKPNAYGTDGYVFFASGNNSQEANAPYSGCLYTGSRSGQIFSNVTTAVKSVGILGDYRASPGWEMGQGGFGNMDDPSLGVGTGIANINYGIFIRRFSDAGVQEIANHLQITFGSGVANVAQVRIGVMTGSGDGQKPNTMILGGVSTPVIIADNAYEKPFWYFWDVTNAVPGDTLILQLEERSVNQQQNISGVVFDQLTVANDAPVIDSVSAAPATVIFTDAQSATTTASVVAHDNNSDPMTYAWSRISGPGVATFEPPSSATTKISFSTIGTYVLQVAVSDGIDAAVTSNLTVQVNLGTGVTYVTYVGAEESDRENETFDGIWGSPTQGYKRDFRSINTGNGSAGTKAYVLEGKPNAYGADGYIVWSSGDSNNTSSDRHTGIRTGTGASTVYSDPAPFLDEVSFIGSYGWVGGGFVLDNNPTTIDDPALGIGTDVANMDVGTMWALNDGVSYATPHVKIRLGSKAASYSPIRIGVLTDRGDSQRPDAMSLGGRLVTNIPQGNYVRPAWHFFDVVNPKAGVDLELALREGDGSASLRCAIHAVVFDAVELPSSGTLFLVK